jgi:hypothetical protein
MATWYVSSVTGDDARNEATAQSASTPWLTIQKAFDTANSGAGLNAGDVVWVSPGAYRHDAAELDVKTNGTLETAAYVKGDPNCTQSWGTSVKPGLCRITRCDSNDHATIGRVIDYAGEAYVEFWDFQIDGNIGNDVGTNYAVEGDAAAAGQKLVRCVIVTGGYQYAVAAIDLDLCAVFSPYSPYNGAKTIKRSLLVGTGNATSGAHTLDACILVNAGISTTAVAKNCLFLGMGACPNNGGADGSDRNVLLCATQMARGTTSNPPDGCFGISCNDDVYSTENFNMGGNYAFCVNDVNAAANGGTDPVSAKAPLFPPALQILRGLEMAFRFRLQDGALSAGTETSETNGMDLVALATRFRGQAASRKYPGPWAQSDKTWTYDATNGNTITIYQTGREVLHVPIKKLTATTWSLTCAYDLAGGTGYPTLTLINPYTGATIASDAVTGEDTSPVTLSVSVDNDDVAQDMVALLVLAVAETSVETSGYGYASFYGLAVS